MFAYARRPLARARKAAAFAAVTAVVASGLTVLAAAAPADAAVSGTISGTVFRDFNDNGVMNTGAAAASGIANDTGTAGITVNGYDRTGALVGTATTGTGGTYTLAVAAAASSAIRVTFSAPTGAYASSVPAAGTTGTVSGARQQFVALGATNVNFGYQFPGDYSQAAAPVVQVIKYAGAPTNATSAAQASVVAISYNKSRQKAAGGNAPDFSARTTVATFGQTGAVGPTAYSAAGNDLFIAAEYKRDSGLTGTNGDRIGQIFRVANIYDSAAVNGVSATASAAAWLDVTAAPLNINVGTVQSNATRGIDAPTAAIKDADAFAKAGKVGIGAMAVTADGTTLYFINLFDKKLYALNIADRSNVSLIGSWSLGLGNGQRADALTIYRGSLYIGFNDTGETGAAATTNPGQAASATGVGMNAYVERTALPNAATAPAYSTVFTGSLGYAKGDIYGNVLVPQSHRWNTWTDDWSWSAYTSAQGNAVAAGSVGQSTTGGWQMYPAPLVSSLYFDEDGYLSIGITDRSEIQGGNRNLAANANTGTYETGASGDTLIAAPNDATLSAFTLENNGKVGTRTSAQQTQTGTGYILQGPTTTSTATDGHEFYNDALNQGDQSSHKETMLGSIAGIRGTGEIVSSVYDPLSGIRLAGNSWYKVSNGEPTGGYEQTPDNGTAQTNTFQKGGGLGSVSILSQLAPVQVGDRVWFDADQDGVQDADEPGLDGVGVTLKNSSGATVATTTTAGGGYYQFTLQPNSAQDLYGAYTVTFTKPTTGSVSLSTLDSTPVVIGTIPWSAMSFTTQTLGTADGSDADTSTGVASVTLAGPGTNTQTVDAGFKANTTFTVSKAIDAAGGTPDAGQTFTLNMSATDFRGASYALATTSVSLAGGATSATYSAPYGTTIHVTESGTAAYKTVSLPPDTKLTTSTTQNLTVTNTLFKPGYFSVKKTVSGAAAASVPSTKQFTIDYAYPAAAPTTTGTITVMNDGVVKTSGAIPYNTAVRLSEETPSGPNGVTWGTPVWSGTGVTNNGDGTATVTIGDGTTIAATITNPVSTTPAVDIETGDGTFDAATSTGTITHDADTMPTATYYNDCSARTIVTTVTNTGNEALTAVTLTDTRVSGPALTGITYYFPDGTSKAATATANGYTVSWTPPAGGWAVGAVIYAKASLVECGSSAPYVDSTSVNASALYSGTAVSDTDKYNALSGQVQVIEYDARQGNPAITDGTGAATVPAKPLTGDATWDANTVANSATYPVNAAQPVCWVVSNNSGSPLTDIALSDATTTGPAFSSTAWTADLSGVGGPNSFNFAGGAVWRGVLKPNASFIVCTTLTLPTANQQHTDRITVTSHVAQPAVDGTGKPTGDAALAGGNPILVNTTAGTPASVTDNDPFNAISGRGPFVDIEIGSAASSTATTIQTDADTAASADSYTPGQAKDMLVVATNTGDEALCHVTITIPEPTGAQIADLAFTFPDGSTKNATKNADGTWTVDWTATDDCSRTWAPGAKIYGHGTLTMPTAGGTPHYDTATVNAQSAASSATVTDTDPYYAYSKAIDVIDYLGTSDPTYGTGTSGTCTVPTVPAAQDANTAAAAVDLPVGTARPVHFLVTNSGGTSLTNISLGDVNAAGSTALTGPFIADLSAYGGPSNYNFTANPTWSGVLPPCASFVVTASLTLAASSTHHDTVSVTGDVVQIAVDGTTGQPTGGPALDSSSKPITTGEKVSDSDPFFAKSGVGPKLDAHVGDGTGTTIAHEGDTMADGVYYDDADGVCTTKTIVLRVTNTGSEALNTVSVNDSTLSGTALGDITWTFPDGTTVTKPAGTAATWAGPWAPGDVITGTATLKLCADSAPHVDQLVASGKGVDSGTSVSSTNRYYAYSGAIQVIEYDGSAATPDHSTGTGTCTVPSKTSLTDVQDADTVANSASWPTNVGQTVRYIVTNTGTTTLTHLMLTDTTDTGATITGWTADLSAYGLTATEPVTGPLDIELPPCASFVVTGTLKIPAANTQHTDHVDVVGTVVVPAVDGDGLPTGEPAMSGGALVTAKDAAGNPITVDDTDPFNALSDNGPHVDIEEGDGAGATYEDADTMTTGSHYDTGGGVCDTKTVTFTVTNTGDETLTPVKVTDTTVSGKDLGTITWTFPDGSHQTAAAGATVTYTGDWAPNAVITGTATLTLCATDAPHVDKVTVVGTGKSSGDTTTDTDFYNAYPGAIQVIEYDGDNAAGDPTISDGTGTCHVPGPLSAAQDANTEADAAAYAVGDERTVRMVVTNTSTTSLTNVDLSDITDEGTAIDGDWTADLSAYGGPADYSFTTSGPWTGVLPPCASFFVTAHLTLGASETHADHVDVTADVVVPATDPTTGAVQTGYAIDGTGAPIVATDPISGDAVTVDDTDPFWASTGVGPRLSAHDGNGTGTGTGAAITHEGDTMADGTYYATPTGSCVTKPVVFTITNNGSETLTDVVLHDTTLSGPAIDSIVWTFPDGSTKTSGADEDVTWAGPWAVGETIYATGQLTLCSDSEPHVDALHAGANSAVTGDPAPESVNYYNAYPGAIQIIEYDGQKADPSVSDGTGTCTIPTVPAAQDANTGGDAVIYPVDTPRTVRMVVTNTSTTYLTNVDVTDITDEGTPIDADWTADLSAYGGPSDYSFATDGPWDGVLPPCASFFITATLELGAVDVHADHADVTADVIVPETDPATHEPTGGYAVDGAGAPVLATDPASGDTIAVTDTDPFHARTGNGPAVDIEKGDGAGTTIAHDADTMDDASGYQDGATHTIVFDVTNTGDENLREVTIRDTLVSGAAVANLEFTLPDGSTLTAVKDGDDWVARWDATYGSGTAVWKPSQVIVGHATLTMHASDASHVDRASVTAVGADSDIAVSDSDDYDAVTGATQVIKYDANSGDPAVKDADGNWIIPSSSSPTTVEISGGDDQTIKWVVTNTGTTWLTNVMVTDVTLNGRAVNSDWTADLSAFGGSSHYSFVKSGPWKGLLPPGASFFSTGTLEVQSGDAPHRDRVDVTADVVAPGQNPDGTPTDTPSTDPGGNPIVISVPGGGTGVTQVGQILTIAPRGTLAFTGMEPFTWVIIASAMLLLGAMLMVFAPRRRRRH